MCVCVYTCKDRVIKKEKKEQYANVYYMPKSTYEIHHAMKMVASCCQLEKDKRSWYSKDQQ